MQAPPFLLDSFTRLPSMATTAASVGVPVKVLHEAEGHPVFVEVKTGESYRGMLSTGEGSMNIQLSNVTHTAKDGRSIK